MKINYMIACSSHRAHRDIDSTPPGHEVLRTHLKQLLLTNLDNLTQITILRALPLERGRFSKEYWDINNHIKELRSRCKVEIYNVKDYWWSYSTWIQGINFYKENFDYYILIEDDFYPEHKDFVNILIRKHQEHLPNGGYLGSFYHCNHIALSNGIVDANTALEGFSKFKDPIKELAPAAQVLFGQLFFKDKMADYTDEFRVLTYQGNTVQELTSLKKGERSEIDIINPIQFLFTDHKF